MTARTIRVEDAALLVQAGMFADGDLVGVDQHGTAIYCGPGRTPIIRPAGPRAEGVRPYRGGARF